MDGYLLSKKEENMYIYILITLICNTYMPLLIQNNIPKSSILPFNRYIKGNLIITSKITSRMSINFWNCHCLHLQFLYFSNVVNVFCHINFYKQLCEKQHYLLNSNIKIFEIYNDLNYWKLRWLFVLVELMLKSYALISSHGHGLTNIV